MADAKFGRLFTEADVGELIRGAWEMGCAAGPEAVESDAYPDLFAVLAHRQMGVTFPPDEPLFLLRGQDRFALGAVWAYIEALAEGVPLGEHGRAAYRAWQAMCRWQQRHPSRLKVPD